MGWARSGHVLLVDQNQIVEADKTRKALVQLEMSTGTCAYTNSLNVVS